MKYGLVHINFSQRLFWYQFFKILIRIYCAHGSDKIIKRGEIWSTDKMLKWIWWFLGSNLCWAKDWRCRLETRLDNRGKKWQWWHHWPQNLDHHRNNLHLRLSLLWFCNYNFSEEKIQSETEKWQYNTFVDAGHSCDDWRFDISEKCDNFDNMTNVDIRGWNVRDCAP